MLKKYTFCLCQSQHRRAPGDCRSINVFTLVLLFALRSQILHNPSSLTLANSSRLFVFHFTLLTMFVCSANIPTIISKLLMSKSFTRDENDPVRIKSVSKLFQSILFSDDPFSAFTDTNRLPLFTFHKLILPS
jgi:hypothetical protein